MFTKDIEQILRERFNPLVLKVVDDSHAHANHAEAKKTGGGHYRIVIVSAAFKDVAPIDRHRMVYDALLPLWKGNIHALAIKADIPT